MHTHKRAHTHTYIQKYEPHGVHHLSPQEHQEWKTTEAEMYALTNLRSSDHEK
jgi:hypothetical protein